MVYNVTHHNSVIDLLPDDLDFTQTITSFPSDCIYRSLLHLLFNCNEELEEWFPRCILDEVIQEERQPVTHHLLSNRLIPKIKKQ